MHDISTTTRRRQRKNDLVPYWTILFLLISLLIESSQPYLIYANRKEIRKFDETNIQQQTLNINKRQNTSVITENLEDAVSIDFDYDQRIIFWSDIGFEAISGLQLNNSHVFYVITTGIISPDGLACDWITKKIYWADSDTNRIEVSHYNGSYRRVLFWENLDQPRAIVLVPMDGIMFWSDWGYMPKIERASMDGNNMTRQIIVNKDIQWPNGLAVDYSGKRLYWVDAKMAQISSVDYDGRNRLAISCGNVMHPFSLTIFDDGLFWTDWGTKNVHYCNTSTGFNKQILINSMKSYNDPSASINDAKKPMGISIFDQSRQPQSASQCQINNGNCSHLCLLSSLPPNHYSCACPTGIKLMEDGKTCFSSPEKMLIVARRNDIRRISLDTKDFTSVILPIRPIKHATVIDYDPVEGRVYWADDEYRVIKRAMLNGTFHETIISTEVHHPDGIAIDWVARNIYWTDAGTNRIEVARLNGSSRTILLNEGLEKLRAIVVHPEKGIMFWSDWGNKAKIERAALDGSDRVVIVNTSITWPNGLAIDYELSNIYWCDAKRDTIEMARFDGTNRKIIWKDEENSHRFGFTVFEHWVYWSDWQRRSVERVLKLTGQGRESIAEQLPDLMGIKAVWVNGDPNQQPLLNPCAVNNGNCSHLCFNRPHYDYVCACPTGYELTNDHRTCTVSEAFFVLLRRNDIRRVGFESNRFDFVPISGLQSAISFDVHVQTNRIYWIDSKAKTISRSLINGSNPETLIHLELETPTSLAIDWIANQIYWTDTELKRIEVARVDGSYRRILYHEQRKMPHSLALDPVAGFLFWSDWSSTGKIERSFLDGEERVTIAVGVGHATSLTLDHESKRIYWITNSSSIMTCSYDGSSRSILLPDGKTKPSSLVLFNESLYFLDRESQTIESIRKDQPERREIVKQNELLSTTTDLLLFHSLYQKGWNFCAVNNGGCQHLCFVKPHKAKSTIANNVHCSCATHYRLDDERNCLQPETFLLFSHRNEVTRFLFDSEQTKNDFQDVTIAIPHTKHIKAIAYDQYDHSIYWIDNKAQTIRRTNANKSGDRLNEIIVQMDGLIDLVIDSYARILFWTSSKTNSINATRLIGLPTEIGSFYFSNVDLPRLLAYHHRQNLLFWTNEPNMNDPSWKYPQIERISMQTMIRTTVVYGNSSQIIAIAVDQEMDLLLWSHRSASKIEYSDLDGKRRSILYEEPNIHPIALATYSRFLFWIEKDRKSIEKLPLDLNMGRNKQTIFSKLSSLTDLISVPLMKKNSSNLFCVTENHGCSHMCMILHNGENNNSADDMAKCGCPKGLVLAADDKQCIEPVKCDAGKFSCSNGIHCIDSIFRCNGSPDCLDNSDEINCPKCGTNQFTCMKNVLSHEELICLDNERLCDGHNDCYDGHDEICCMDRFRCSSHHCLTAHQLCDGKKDCIDGDDEDAMICKLYPEKTSFETKSSYSVIVVMILLVCFIIFLFYHCKRCFGRKNDKDMNDILMTEQHSSMIPNSTFGGNGINSINGIGGTRHNRNPHRLNNNGSLLHEKNVDHCNTLTSTTTISCLDTLPNDTRKLAQTTTVDMGPSMCHPTIQTKLLVETNIGSSNSSSTPGGSYPFETINPPPSPATERSQSAYSSHSSSLFVPRTRSRSKNGGMLSIGVNNNNGNKQPNRRHKKSRWNKNSQRGPPPTPCGTDVYDDLEPTSVKYVFYDNAQSEIEDYRPPPPTPRHYFSDNSCPPSPVTENSF